MNERDLVVVRRLFNARRVQLTMLAVRYGIVAANASRDYPEAGGLMSYGTDVTDAFRQAGIYAGRVLKGAKPALGWMAPLRHLGAKVLVGREPPARASHP